LKKLCWSCLKFMLLFIIIISSSLAIYMHYMGSAFDPIREIKRLKSENRRDDALDLARKGGRSCGTCIVIQEHLLPVVMHVPHERYILE